SVVTRPGAGGAGGTEEGEDASTQGGGGGGHDTPGTGAGGDGLGPGRGDHGRGRTRPPAPPHPGDRRDGVDDTVADGVVVSPGGGQGRARDPRDHLPGGEPRAGLPDEGRHA